jgi:hypothetical protein
MVRSFLAPLIVVSLPVVLFADPQETGEAIDTQRSSITIHVGKSGVFAGAALARQKIDRGHRLLWCLPK